MSEDGKPLVIISEFCDERPLAWLRERVRVEVVKYDDPAFPARLREADGLIVRTYTRVTEPFLGAAPRLKVVARGGVGLDNIDVAACRRRGIEVVYTPDANTLAVGDYVFGAVLQLLRPWARFKDRAYTKDEFQQIRAKLRGRQLDELTIGILGMGRVGKRVGQIAANGFNMRVIYNDLLDIRPESLSFPATPVDKPALYRDADILTMHTDMRPGNRHLVGRDQLALMKTDAILVNASRGEVLDVHALAQTMRAGKLAGAVIDVYDPEPPPADFPLLGMDNVILTPHMASRTSIATENMSWVVRDVVEVLEGRAPQYPAP
jgi:phosphoglycerate dehydrogenase-like enzyme